MTLLSSSAGINRPNLTISDNNPTVFNNTVLPPVLGPVIIIPKYSLPKFMLLGITFSTFNNGWRAFFKSKIPTLFTDGALPLYEIPNKAFEKILSNSKYM